MGEAKRRGNREQRIALAVERRKAENAALHERYQREEAERRARLSALPAEERKPVILAGGGGSVRRHVTLAALLGLSAPLLVVADPERDDIGGSDK